MDYSPGKVPVELSARGPVLYTDMSRRGIGRALSTRPVSSWKPLVVTHAKPRGFPLYCEFSLVNIPSDIIDRKKKKRRRIQIRMLISKLINTSFPSPPPPLTYYTALFRTGRIPLKTSFRPYLLISCTSTHNTKCTTTTTMTAAAENYWRLPLVTRW